MGEEENEWKEPLTLAGIRQRGQISLASVHPSCFSGVRGSSLFSFPWVLLSLWSWV